MNLKAYTVLKKANIPMLPSVNRIRPTAQSKAAVGQAKNLLFPLRLYFHAKAAKKAKFAKKILCEPLYLPAFVVQ
jgi:hypothetical protein